MLEQLYFVRNMEVRPGDDVLEIGVGSGVLSLIVGDTAAAVTGVDGHDHIGDLPLGALDDAAADVGVDAVEQ